MTVTAYLLLNRRFDWTECIAVIGAVAFYQIGFALFGRNDVCAIGRVRSRCHRLLHAWKRVQYGRRATTKALQGGPGE